jgi:hypothetical protein
MTELGGQIVVLRNINDEHLRVLIGHEGRKRHNTHAMMSIKCPFVCQFDFNESKYLDMGIDKKDVLLVRTRDVPDEERNFEFLRSSNDRNYHFTQGFVFH